jgi:hypothetical protein
MGNLGEYYSAKRYKVKVFGDFLAFLRKSYDFFGF